MDTNRRTFILAGGIAVAALAVSRPTFANTLSAEEARQIAEDAYVYGYSLITTEVTRVQGSNVSKPDGIHAPTGQFGNIEKYPPADFRLVSAPQCGHPLFRCLARPEGAAGLQSS